MQSGRAYAYSYFTEEWSGTASPLPLQQALVDVYRPIPHRQSTDSPPSPSNIEIPAPKDFELTTIYQGKELIISGIAEYSLSENYDLYTDYNPYNNRGEYHNTFTKQLYYGITKDPIASIFWALVAGVVVGVIAFFIFIALKLYRKLK